MFRGQCTFAYWQESKSLGILKAAQCDDDERRESVILHSFIYSFLTYLLRVGQGGCFLSTGGIAVRNMGKAPAFTGVYAILEGTREEQISK